MNPEEIVHELELAFPDIRISADLVEILHDLKDADRYAIPFPGRNITFPSSTRFHVLNRALQMNYEPPHEVAVKVRVAIGEVDFEDGLTQVQFCLVDILYDAKGSVVTWDFYEAMSTLKGAVKKTSENPDFIYYQRLLSAFD